MSLKRILVFALPFVALVGCDSNPTNAPSEAAIKQADADRLKAVDADPNMSAQDKENLKRAMGLNGGGSDRRDKR